MSLQISILQPRRLSGVRREPLCEVQESWLVGWERAAPEREGEEGAQVPARRRHYLHAT